MKNGQAKNVNKPPGLLQDIGAVAGLYKTVFWMWGQRIQRGSDWEQRLTEDALRIHEFQAEDAERAREHVHN
jgi:hypothetical protein